MGPQSLAETMKQDSLERAEREEALTQYIRAALAARAAQHQGKEHTVATQSIAETLRQDSIRRAEREAALASYIRDARAAREAEALALARPRVSIAQRVRGLALPAFMRLWPGAQA
jgi:hypothetical protein